jgi:competence protein ComEA
MRGLIKSFTPFIKKYAVESFLICIAFLIGGISLIIYIGENDIKNVETAIQTDSLPQEKNPEIVVDVSGAVKKPFVYAFNSKARFIDAIQKAGGLTDEADAAFVARNINYARILSDQEKIYIPFLSDTINGVVGENKRIIEYIQPNTFSFNSSESKTMNINTASILQLDELPGVGKVQADAIFKGKPYYASDDLLKNKIIPQSTYEKIKELISVY